MLSFRQYLIETTDTFWHGSATGQFGNGVIHVGTKEAATQALEARIGVPATGVWDGTREYGKTKLAGRKTIMKKARGEYLLTGENASPPDNDYLPKGMATYGDGSKVSMSARPNIFQVRITGKMFNNQWTPISDDAANSRLKRTKSMGYYYSNVGEDSGSVSAGVPSASWLARN